MNSKIGTNKLFFFTIETRHRYTLPLDSSFFPSNWRKIPLSIPCINHRIVSFVDWLKNESTGRFISPRLRNDSNPKKRIDHDSRPRFFDTVKVDKRYNSSGAHSPLNAFCIWQLRPPPPPPTHKQHRFGQIATRWVLWVIDVFMRHYRLLFPSRPSSLS